MIQIWSIIWENLRPQSKGANGYVCLMGILITNAHDHISNLGLPLVLSWILVQLLWSIYTVEIDALFHACMQCKPRRRLACGFDYSNHFRLDRITFCCKVLHRSGAGRCKLFAQHLTGTCNVRISSAGFLFLRPREKMRTRHFYTQCGYWNIHRIGMLLHLNIIVSKIGWKRYSDMSA